MTTELDPTAAPPPAPTPTGLKAKANEIGLKVFMASPPKVQNAMLTGVTKAQPVVAKVSRYKKPLLAGTGALIVVRKVRRRRKG